MFQQRHVGTAAQQAMHRNVQSEVTRWSRNGYRQAARVLQQVHVQQRQTGNAVPHAHELVNTEGTAQKAAKFQRTLTRCWQSQHAWYNPAEGRMVARCSYRYVRRNRKVHWPNKQRTMFNTYRASVQERTKRRNAQTAEQLRYGHGCKNRRHEVRLCQQPQRRDRIKCPPDTPRQFSNNGRWISAV